MKHIETARINDLIGLQIGTIQEAAQELNADSDVQSTEEIIDKLEKSIADLKDSLAALPH